MIKNQSIIFLCFLLTLVYDASAQQPIHNQYLFNQFAINPAFAGSQDALNVTTFGRRNWSNIEGAPITCTFSAHSPLKNEKMGLGILISNDRISIFNHTIVNAAYSYKVFLTEKVRLSFGLQAGFANFNARYSELNAYMPNDPGLATNDVSSFTPSFGGGLYLQSEKLSLGLSVPYFSSNIFKTRTVAHNFQISNTYLLSGSYILDISDDVKFKPACLLKYNPGSPFQTDIYANFLFKDILGVGVSYRTWNYLGMIIQVNLTEQLRIGYSYENSLGKLSHMTSFSHDLVINYLFSFKKSKVVSPRFF